MFDEAPKSIEGSQIRSVAKALTIVELLAKNKSEMSLAEIAKEMNLAKSTVHGLLSTLREFGYVEQSAFDGKYRLGMRLFEIGSVVANTWDVRRIAAPFLQNLVDNLEETVHLVVLDQGEVLYIDKRECKQSLRIVSQVGNRLPAHCTAVGKALLAYLPASELRRIVATRGLQAYTQNTITDVTRLEQELERVRQQGFATEKGEIMDGLSCVAVPLRDHTGRVCAAMSVAGPSVRLEGAKFQLVVNEITRAGREISASLGYRQL